MTFHFDNIVFTASLLANERKSEVRQEERDKFGVANSAATSAHKQHCLLYLFMEFNNLGSPSIFANCLVDVDETV